MHKSGDVILTEIQFTDSFETKKRPALILFEEHNNFIVAGITSNQKMEGIKLEKKDGAIKESIIKLNYIFTISNNMIQKKLFSLNQTKKALVYEKLKERLEQLNT
jgi:mRNA interferase MazF